MMGPCITCVYAFNNECHEDSPKHNPRPGGRPWPPILINSDGCGKHLRPLPPRERAPSSPSHKAK